MISKNRIKFIQSLHKKKYRQRYGQFTVEGTKSVVELIHSPLQIDEILASPDWLNQNKSILHGLLVTEANNQDLSRISFFATSSPVLAIAKIPDTNAFSALKGEWSLALDGINDPGNLGSIIRIADWYGIKQLALSDNTVDVYNPKVISASMGSFTRCSFSVVKLETTFSEIDVPIYYCLMKGNTLHNYGKAEPGLIVIGSESHGIRENLLNLTHVPITINRIGDAESLNAAIATGIVCDRLIQP